MVWFRVDDGLAFHAKVIRAGNPAMGLWVRAGAWCSQHLTDGVIPHETARVMATSQREITSLLKAGLWEEVVSADGELAYRFHDWEVQNPSRTDVELRRNSENEKKARWRAKKANSGTTPGDGGMSTVDSSPVHGGQVDTSTVSRPDPSLKNSRPRTDEDPEGFADWWSAYPRKEAKRAAVTAYRAAIKRGATPAQLLAAVGSYAFSEERRFQPMPATWLNQDRFADEKPTTPQKTQKRLQPWEM